MRFAHLSLLVFAPIFFAACSNEPANETPEQKEERVLNEAAECDPLVGEFRDLMADYEKELGAMVAAKKIEPETQQRFSQKAMDLTKRIQERGETALGVKCWTEFNSIGQTYVPRIAKLSMQAMTMEGGMESLEGMDPAAMQQLKKMIGQ